MPIRPFHDSRDQVVDVLNEYDCYSSCYIPLRLSERIAQYFWQWNARTDRVTISHELLSMDNFATFHPIHSSMRVMFLFLPKIDWMNFETIRRQELQKPHFRDTIYSLFALLFRYLGLSCSPRLPLNVSNHLIFMIFALLSSTIDFRPLRIQNSVCSYSSVTTAWLTISWYDY